MFREKNFAISEVINDCMICNEAERLGIKLIDVTEGKEVQEVINSIPKKFSDQVKSLKEKAEQLNMSMIYKG